MGHFYYSCTSCVYGSTDDHNNKMLSAHVLLTLTYFVILATIFLIIVKVDKLYSPNAKTNLKWGR